MKILTLIFICALTFACASNDEKSKIRIGSEGILRGGSSGLTVAAIDYQTLNQLAKAQIANDKQGIDEIKFSERVRWVPDDTKVLVIGGDWAAYEVRVLEGNHKGKAVWVDASAVVEPSEQKTEKSETQVTPPTKSPVKTQNFSQLTKEEQLLTLLDEERLDTTIGETEKPENLIVVENLIKNSVDVNARNKTGETPVMLAVENNRLKSLKMLLKAKADPNLQDNEGMTALMTAAIYSKPEMVKILLDNGAKTGIKDNKGSTAIESSQYIGDWQNTLEPEEKAEYLEIRRLLKSKK